MIALETDEPTKVHPMQGRALIVGSHVYKSRTDRRALYPDAIGVDLLAGPGVDRVLNMEDDLPQDFGQFDHVDCVSVLEHSKRPWLLAANIENCLRIGGTLLLQVPFVWRVHAYPSDFWRFTTEGVQVLFPRIKWSILNFGSGNERRLIPVINQNGSVFFRRTQVHGFGMRV